MAIRIGLGVPILNHRWSDATVDSTIADGWTDATTDVTLSHTYDTRGFGVQNFLATGAIAASAVDYISYRTEAVGVRAATRYGLRFCAQTDEAGAEIYYQVIGKPSNDVLFGTTTQALADAGQLYSIVALGSSNQGTDNDTYFEIRIGVDTLSNTKNIEFSRFVVLRHTFESDADYKEMSVNPQVDGSVIGGQGFAAWQRDSAAQGYFMDGTAGERKQRLVLPFKQVPQTDLAWLEQFYHHTRSTKAADANRWLVVEDTSLPAPGDDILGAAQINPNYYAWVDPTFPFDQPSNTWFPSDSTFQGVMNLEEP